MADLVARKTPSKLTFNVSFHSLKSISSSFPEGPEIPALLINTSMLLNLSFISLKKD